MNNLNEKNIAHIIALNISITIILLVFNIIFMNDINRNSRQLYNGSGFSRIDIIEKDIADIHSQQLNTRLNTIEEKKRQYEKDNDSITYYDAISTFILSQSCSGVYLMITNVDLNVVTGKPVYNIQRLGMHNDPARRVMGVESDKLKLSNKPVGEYFCLNKEDTEYYYSS